MSRTIKTIQGLRFPDIDSDGYETLCTFVASESDYEKAIAEYAAKNDWFNPTADVVHRDVTIGQIFFCIGAVFFKNTDGNIVRLRHHNTDEFLTLYWKEPPMHS